MHGIESEFQFSLNTHELIYKQHAVRFLRDCYDLAQFEWQWIAPPYFSINGERDTHVSLNVWLWNHFWVKWLMFNISTDKAISSSISMWNHLFLDMPLTSCYKFHVSFIRCKRWKGASKEWYSPQVIQIGKAFISRFENVKYAWNGESTYIKSLYKSCMHCRSVNCVAHITIYLDNGLVYYRFKSKKKIHNKGCLSIHYS